MKFLLDMGLARSTAQFLRALGHDAVHTELITTKDVAQTLGLSERITRNLMHDWLASGFLEIAEPFAFEEE